MKHPSGRISQIAASACRAVAVFLMVFVLGGAALEMQAQPTVSKEYQVKAAFLFHFMQFIEWPQTNSTNAPVSIGILGDDPFGTALEEVIKGEMVQGRKLAVRRSNRVEDLKDCHLVFISKTEKGDVSDTLAKLESSPIVTVGEADGFARRGGIINFFLEGKKVRFEINASKARSNGLKISSQLLSLGKIVEPDPPKGAR